MPELRGGQCPFEADEMILLSVISLAVILYIVYRIFNTEADSFRYWYAGGLVVKLAAGIALGLVYTHYYKEGDTLQYFEDASKLTTLWGDSPASFLQAVFQEPPEQLLSRLYDESPRALTFIKSISMINLLAFNNYWVAASYLSIFSFMACWYLVKQVRSIFPKWGVEAIIAFLFLPSFIFWSSGIIKESIAALSMIFIAGIFLKAYHQQKIRWHEWLLAIACTVAFWQLKYYWAGLFFVFAGSAMLAQWGSALFRPRAVVRWAQWGVALLILGYIATFLQPNLNLDRVLGVVVENNNAFVSLSGPDDVIHFNDLEPTITSFAMNTPLAIWSGLFRPWLGEANSAFKIASSVENTLILLITLLAILRLFRSDRQISFPGIVTLGYCLSLCIFLALSTPNFGTLSRYRIGFLPFFVFLMLIQSGIVPMISRKFRGQ